MSLLGVLSIARDALMAQTAGIDVTGQNISNATTPGYVRRSAILETLPLDGSQSGGVRFTGVQRSFDRFAFGRVSFEQGLLGAANARSSALADVQAIMAPSNGSIGDRLSSFFSSLQTLTGSPTDTSARQQVLSSAQAVADGISQTASSLAQKNADMLSQAQDAANGVNDKLSQIAKLDDQIQRATALGDSAADLRDQRDGLVKDVATAMGARTVEDDQGHFTLLSSGVALVDGTSAAQVAVTTDTNGALKITAQKNGVTTDITSHVDTGTLGGLREARDTDLAKARSDLDQLAYDLSGALNTAHASGYGLDGVNGRNLFTQPAQVAGAAAAMALDPQMAGHPERVAAAASTAELPGGNGNALALAQLATAPLGGGTLNPSERYAAMDASVGSAKSAADDEQSLRQSTSAQATSLEQSASGVNLDEEMVSLSQYQTAFQAAQKVMSVTNQLLGDLMQEL